MLNDAAPLLAALGRGAADGLQFNVLIAAVTAALAAAVSGYPRAPRSHLAWSAGILALGWLAGDGLRLLDSTAHADAAFAASALLGFAVGYLLPALAGAYVGRHVHKGTGYLSAGVVAFTFVPAIATLAAALARSAA